MFKIEDLKFGDIIILKNNEKFIYLGQGFARNSNDDYIVLYYYQENLNHKYKSKFDIIKVQRYCIEEPTPYYILETLFERSKNEQN